jgi:hypothetical protein
MKGMIKRISLGLASCLLVAVGLVGSFGTPSCAATGPCYPALGNKYIENHCQTCISTKISTGALAGNESDKVKREACYATGDQNVETVWTFVRTVINWILIAVGLICVIFIIWGGIRYATSGGDTEKVKNAKNTLLYAIIGLAIALLAAVIVNIVFDVTGMI